MTPKQKKAKARLTKKLKEILGSEYKRASKIGSAKYNSWEEFVQKAIDYTREERKRNKKAA